MRALSTWLGLTIMLCMAGPVAAQFQADPDEVLRTTIETARVDDLRWPDFSDYRDAVRRFYDDVDGLAWFHEGTPTKQALAIAEVLAHADERGVNAIDYDGPRWEERLQAAALGPAVRTLTDVALTVSLMRYVSDLHIGRVNPQRLGFEFHSESKKYDLPELVGMLTVYPYPTSLLEGIEPPFQGYRALQEALAQYRALEDTFAWEPIPGDDLVKPGAELESAPYLGGLLVALGDLPQDRRDAGAGGVYTSELAEAMRRFQARHGLEPDGVIGNETRTELNTPLARRIEQIQLTLERWRWLPDNFPEGPIVVNIPAFTLRAYEEAVSGSLPALEMNVIVGKEFPDRQTPIFAENMTYLEFSPYWNVPHSIAVRDILPALEKDPGELERRNMELLAGYGPRSKPREPTPENLRKLKSGKLRLRQRPGPTNALGAVKFIFPNQHNVYLHGTPNRSLFARERRAYSSGCVRVEDPSGLAGFVLRSQEDWTDERIQKAMKSGVATKVDLDQPVPVFMVYGTALVDLGDGAVHFWRDLYGHDQALSDALAEGYPYPW